MSKIKKIFIIIVLFLFSINYVNAENKVSYINIDYILSNTLAGKSLLTYFKNEEKLKVDKFKISDEKFKNQEKKILAKKNLISKDELNKELKLLQIEFNKYNKNRMNQIEELKKKRNVNILNFLKLINPIIEKYMADNSIYMLMDKKNVFIASKKYDVTDILIELIDNKIKTFEIK